MTRPLTISKGLPEALRDDAARLYWQAFGGKLGRVMGPDAKAHLYLQRVIEPEFALVACDADGALLGLAGFKTPEGGFAGGSWGDLRATYGLFGMAWRGTLLALLSREIDNERFLLDGICVAASARSQGVGSALIAAIEDEARARGYTQLRLDVVDSNWRAKALYERLGFAVAKTDRLGLLRYAFGFDAAHTMVKPL